MKQYHISSTEDLYDLLQETINLTMAMGFSKGQSNQITTAVSEIARNQLLHAKGGEVTINQLVDAEKKMIEITLKDQGPGIADIELAMQDHYSSVGGLGIGLPGAKRLVDDFKIESQLGVGTKVILRKWIAR
ncbi:MAG: anti-sigma regulatory factor [Cyclobacteriaceae bacterium]